MRGMGDSKNPLYFVAIACVINIVLDLLLVAKYGMGAGESNSHCYFSGCEYDTMYYLFEEKWLYI